MIEQGIKELLANNAAVAAFAPSIRPLSAAQGDGRPYILYSVTAGENTGDFKGQRQYRKATVELAIFADTYLGCQQLSDACRETLDGQASTCSTVRVSSHFEDETDIEQPVKPGAGAPVYLRSQVYKTLYRPLVGGS